MFKNADIENETWFTLFWNIKNYSYCWQKKGVPLSSPLFKVSPIENTSWVLFLYPNGFTGEGFISFSLIVSRDDSKSIEIEYDLAILAMDGSVLPLNERERIRLEEECDLGFGSELFELRENVTITSKEKFLSKDSLMLQCRVWRVDEKAGISTRLFARTVLNVKKWNFLWNIRKFSSLKSGKLSTYEIQSESEDEEMMTFSIRMNKEGKITIYIEYIDTELIKYLKFQTFIRDKNGTQTDCEKCEISSYDKYALCTLPFNKTFFLDNKSLFLENDVLSLYCECSWCDGFAPREAIKKIDLGITIASVYNQISSEPNASHTEVKELDEMVDLKEDFHCLYDESILTDVKLRTATQTFQAHKNILSARSPVFRAMFMTDMKEKIQESVDLPDLEDDTVRRMLLYMYTNALDGLQFKSALKLYAAADKYEITTLKNKCSSFLKKNLCPNNVCDVLVLSHMHADNGLKETAQGYALEHERNVFPSEEWKIFAKTNSTLASETMLLKWNKN